MKFPLPKELTYIKEMLILPIKPINMLRHKPDFNDADTK